MTPVKRIINCVLVLLLCNAPLLRSLAGISTALKIIAAVLLSLFFIGLNVRPFAGKGLQRKLKTLGAGCELLLTAAVCNVCQFVIYILLWLSPYEPRIAVLIGNIVLSLLLLAAVLFCGLVRLFFSSGQITTAERVALIFLWWVPAVNIAVFARVYGKAAGEFEFRLEKLQRNNERRCFSVCATKYPLLLVHGIFFRDWKVFNYWGRIPAELEENGARIFYGGQQSSSSVERSAGELRDCILDIIEKEGCEKVNIIAHSKGGLDSRYAISCLGMDQYVASLTTVNTPHRGCRFARQALENIPEGMVSKISKSYDKIFCKLGDDQPDFFTGVSELTDEKCAELNGLMEDRPGVLYQSIGSRMKSAASAVFPLNLGYGIVNALDGPSDGLVTVESMPWGEFTMLEPKGEQGISHGDVIDLTRKNVEGFDICEFYVELVSRLKDKGL